GLLAHAPGFRCMLRLAYVWLLRRCLVAFAIVCAISSGAIADTDDSRSTTGVTAVDHERALETLRTALRTQPKWAKVHAAEFLLGLGFPQGVAKEFEKELGNYGGEPQYRVGIWRVLARSADGSDPRNGFILKILDAASDGEGPDRLHAVE